jgi:hypothetical protein
MYTQRDNIITITRTDCSQLFFIYTGLRLRVGGVPALDFLKKSGLANRNIVLARDPHKAGFRLGISESIPDLHSLVDWQAEVRHELSHVSQVYCIGNSAGGLAAIVAGHQLEAATVWSFGTRPPPKRRWLYPPGKNQQESYARHPYSARLPESRSDPDSKFSARLDTAGLNEAMERLSNSNGTTEYRLYYVPSNEPDSFVHRHLSKCPGTVSCPIEPMPGWSEHMILSILDARDELPSLFPPLVPA